MTDAEKRFIEQMGVISQRNGSPRISGRILGLLILKGEPVALQAITESLQVSKASASTNARQLKDKGLVRLTTVPGQRQDYYEMVPNPFESMLRALSEEMTQAAAEIAESMALFGDSQAGVVERIAQLQTFYQGSAEFLAEVSKNLSKSSLNLSGSEQSAPTAE